LALGYLTGKDNFELFGYTFNLNKENFLSYLVALIIIAFVKLLLLSVYAALSGKLIEQILAKIRVDLSLSNSTRSLDTSIFYLSNVSVIGSCIWALLEIYLNLLFTAILLLGILATFPLHFLFFSIPLLLIFLCTIPFFKISEKYGSLYYSLLGKTFNLCQDVILGRREINQFQLHSLYRKKVKAINDDLIRRHVILASSRQLVIVSPEFISTSLVLISLFVVYRFNIIVDLGQISFLFIGLIRILSYLGLINGRTSTLIESRELFFKIFQSIDSSSGTELNMTPLDKSQSFIRAENLKLKVGVKLIAIEDFHINLPCNLVITGPNGAGKTSLIKAISGNLEYEGSLKIFGIEAREQQQISEFLYMPQDPHLFNETLVFNITLKEETSITETENFFKERYNISIEEILGKPLDSKVKDNGKNLSGGQKQLINILRSLFHKKEFLLLDEPYNHLSKHNISIFKPIFEKVVETTILIDHVHSYDKFHTLALKGDNEKFN
jgi:ABC-type multidrug transport system fused ATPase/permease subunit